MTPLSCFSILFFSFCPFLLFSFHIFFTSLVALVSEFNCRCFASSRCSMEMWCLYDKGRVSWDGVGPLGKDHDSILQSGVEALRMKKTEPLQLGLLLQLWLGL